MTDSKWLKILGWVATCTAMLMYISYFPQIVSNLILWVSYGFFREKKDWPIIVANLPGVVFGTLAAITAL